MLLYCSRWEEEEPFQSPSLHFAAAAALYTHTPKWKVMGSAYTQRESSRAFVVVDVVVPEQKAALPPHCREGGRGEGQGHAQEKSHVCGLQFDACTRTASGLGPFSTEQKLHAIKCVS